MIDFHNFLKNEAGITSNEFETGYKWTHYKGNIYEIIAVGLKEDTGEPMVVYRSLKYNTIWIRALYNWLENVQLPTGIVKRFTPGVF